jgi:hypothetical protein
MFFSIKAFVTRRAKVESGWWWIVITRILPFDVSGKPPTMRTLRGTL